MVIVADFPVVEPARIRRANWQFVADGHALGPVLAGKDIDSAYEDVQEFPDFVEVIGIGECPVVEGCGDDSVWYLVCGAGVGLGGDATCPDRRRRGPVRRCLSPGLYLYPVSMRESLMDEASFRNNRPKQPETICRIPGKQGDNFPDSAGRAQLTYALFSRGVCCVPVRARAPLKWVWMRLLCSTLRPPLPGDPALEIRDVPRAANRRPVSRYYQSLCRCHRYYHKGYLPLADVRPGWFDWCRMRPGTLRTGGRA